MRFMIIDPRHRTTEIVDLPDFADALERAGLTPSEVDHGTISRGHALAVAEYGLFQPPGQQSYFAIGRRLYAGAAAIYAYDAEGRSISLDMATLLQVRWFRDMAEIEAAIAADEIERPTIAVNGRTVWQWPQPRPDLNPVAKELATHVVGDVDVVIDGDTVIKRLP